MFIFIEAITGLTIRIQVANDDTIRSIKYRIMLSEDLPISEQNLIYQDTNLEDFRTVNHYGISNGATLKLIMKMKGGPLSSDIVFEDCYSDLDITDSSNLTDRLAIMFLDNGDFKLLPLLKISFENNKLNESKTMLNDLSLYSPTRDSLDDQKLTILKLKMDKIRLGKRLSNMQGQTHNGKSGKVIQNQTDISDVNKSTHHNIVRSISLNPRPQDLNPDNQKPLSDLFSPKLPSDRSPSLGIHRTMSFLDSVKMRKSNVKLPFIQNLEKNKQILTNYTKSFNKSFWNINVPKEFVNESRSILPPLDELEDEGKKSTKRNRCAVCHKRLTIVNCFACRCVGKYCSQHRYPEEHGCPFDFKTQGQFEILKSNPHIIPEKITKI